MPTAARDTHRAAGHTRGAFVTEPLLLRVEEVASALALGRSKVYELIASGELPSLTIGAARRVPAEALRRYVAEHLEAAAREAR